MQANHTPGPWTADGATVTAPARHAVSQRIADCRALLPDTELRANAALIAAAPDMLAALRAVADYWAGGDVPADIDSMMRAAIARATGEA